ncbi:RNA methyltransferase [Nitrospirota bacterium]
MNSSRGFCPVVCCIINAMKNNWKDNVSIVLVEPTESGNVGATARAMKNMGFGSLELVNPPEITEQAVSFAHNSTDVLSGAVSHSTLDEAIADKALVIGVSRRKGKRRGQWISLEEAAFKSIEMSGNNKVALLFGREKKGLFNEEAFECNYMISIPVEPEQPSLNLSHAVMVVAYEFHKKALEIAGQTEPKPTLAAHRELKKLYERMFDILVALGYTKWGDRDMGKNIIAAIKSFLDRAELEERDVRILNGVCGRLESKLRGK